MRRSTRQSSAIRTIEKPIALEEIVMAAPAAKRAIKSAQPSSAMATPAALAAEVPASTPAAPAPLPPAKLLEEAWRFQVDLWQRGILFLDTLRERANNMLAHEQAGLPPLLNFEYESSLDARRFERPANYALLRITGSGMDTVESCERPDA